MPPHDDGHIHWASPICSLPPEPSSHNITMTAQQQLLQGTNPPKTMVCPSNNLDLPMDPTASDIVRNDRNRFSQGKRCNQSTEISIQHRCEEEDCNCVPKPQEAGKCCQDEPKTQQIPAAMKLVTSTQFSWKRGFFTKYKTPTRQMTPLSKPCQPETPGHNHSTTTLWSGSRNGGTRPEGLSCWVAQESAEEME